MSFTDPLCVGIFNGSFVILKFLFPTFKRIKDVCSLLSVRLRRVLRSSSSMSVLSANHHLSRDEASATVRSRAARVHFRLQIHFELQKPKCRSGVDEAASWAPLLTELRSADEESPLLVGLTCFAFKWAEGGEVATDASPTSRLRPQ